MDSPEYKALNQCSPTLAVCIQQSPDDVTPHLRSSGILAPGDLSFLSNPQHNNDEKARKILDVVLNQVQVDPRVFHKFVSAMKAAGSWTNSAVELLEHSLQEARQSSSKSVPCHLKYFIHCSSRILQSTEVDCYIANKAVVFNLSTFSSCM